MSDKKLADYTAQDLCNPALDASTLRDLAAERRDLWPNIMMHPACYTELKNWIAAQMPVEPVKTPVSAPTVATPATEPVTESVSVPVAEPVAQPVSAPVTAGTTAPAVSAPAGAPVAASAPAAPVAPAGTPATAPVATSAPAVAPAAAPAASLAGASQAPTKPTNVIGLLSSITPIVNSACAALFVGAIFFLPFSITHVSGESITMTLVDISKFAGTLSDLPYYIAIGIATLAVSIASFFLKHRALTIVGMLINVATLVMAGDVFINLLRSSARGGDFYISPGIGIILFLLLNVVMLVFYVFRVIRPQGLKNA